MTPQLRLIVGGLPRGIGSQELQQLIQPFGASPCAVMDVPGNNDQAMAIVHVGADMPRAARLRERLCHRRVNGRKLWAWISVLPWA